MDSYLKLPEKGLIARYKVAHLLAKRKKALTDAESVIAPALAIVVEEILGTAAAEKVRRVPLSNDTIFRRIDNLSSDLKDQFCEHFVKEDELSVLRDLQVNESTDRTGKAYLLAFIRFIKDPKLVNKFFFCKELEGTTTGEDILKLVNENVFNQSIQLLFPYAKSIKIHWNSKVNEYWYGKRNMQQNGLALRHASRN